MVGGVDDGPDGEVGGGIVGGGVVGGKVGGGIVGGVEDGSGEVGGGIVGRVDDGSGGVGGGIVGGVVLGGVGGGIVGESSVLDVSGALGVLDVPAWTIRSSSDWHAGVAPRKDCAPAHSPVSNSPSSAGRPPG